NGGNYPQYFRFKQVETLPTERNAAMLASSQGTKPMGSLVAFTSYAWYDNYAITGIVRGGGTNTLGYAVDINSQRVLTVSPSGEVLPANYNNFDSRYDNIPVGSPIPWPQPNPPSGYLTCNGQSFNKSTYPRLAAAYPSGVLPDLRGEFIRGWDDGRGVDPGRVCGSWQADLLASHKHGYRDRYYIENMNSLHRANNKEATPAGYNGNVGSDGTDTDNNSFLYIDSTTSTTGGNETRPRNIAFNYIVRAA
ncbi:tail fiber protein, partial [Photorhabdus sp. APURE]|uniref:phage tail protein n=1 Tax=Photorhabdus aballayi TaxID=2991723 RepID=UPI00223CB0F6